MRILDLPVHRAVRSISAKGVTSVIGTTMELVHKFNALYLSYIGKGSLHRLLCLFDLVLAFVVHGSSITDCFEYEFFRKSYFERREFVTFRYAQRLYSLLNDKTHTHKFRDKFEFNKEFDAVLGRHWICPQYCTADEFMEFTRKHSPVIAKPRFGGLGNGIRKVNLTDCADADQFFTWAQNMDLIVEQCIDQLDIMSRLHPPSVNTVRVTTAVANSEILIMSAALRIGNRGAYVDNHAAGGILAAIDIDSGVVMSQGIDKYGRRYVVHPMTGERIVGLEIPYWNETVQLVRHLALVVPQVRYVGWDIALTKSGPILVEGNDRGMFDVQQQADQIGKRKLYEKVLSGFTA